MPSEESPVDLALRALSELRKGNLSTGIGFYEQALEGDGHRLPVGVHLLQLTGLGLTDAAARLARLALLKNADLTLSWALNGLRSPKNAVVEYEKLFADGRANTRMVSNYMSCLSLLGESDRLAAISAPGELFREETLQVAGALAPMLARVRSAIVNAKERRFRESEFAARNLERVHRTHQLTDIALVELHDVIRQHVAAYLQAVVRTGHLIAPWVPKRFDLRSWAVISEGSGHLVPHIHSGCWIIGVVYIDGDGLDRSGTDAGCLRVGATPEGERSCLGWPDFVVAPTPGKIVLMPAFYTHWVEPVPQATSRISLAFNVVDAEPQVSG